ncbi:hypothetical protein DCAR_0625037 [Daucus carota subsp. sativus]|uniref:Uncharacterized protein n=1 Tax=Daucus carota subsp. sativus TaxID=79200 RepID=A0A161XEZ4_DAUCS|nr:hypothetical protein DCAR_0625037 [Daucus carota subsp. sativus]
MYFIRISDPAYCVNTFEHVTEETPPLFSVEDIKKLQMDYVEVRCKITVKKVDEKSNWYDDVCSTCGTEVTTVDGRYRCVICSRNVPFPDKRFRIATLCNDTTGLIAIVFPDDEIQRIIGKNAFELEDEVGDENKFPSLLKGFEKKDYVITLTITERNVKKTSNIYTATEISDPVEVLGNHSPTKEAEVTTGEEPVVNLGMSPRVDNSDNVTATEIPCSLTAKTSPPTANSSNKSRSREKKKDVEYELEDDVPIGKFKIPKTEKHPQNIFYSYDSMANRKYDSFSSLNASKSDWIVPTRVLNLWRGYRKTGEPFKGFNLLLLDHKRSRVHAFVPYNLVDEFEPMIQIGNLYVLENFSVKPYTADDKFRCLRKKYQIVFNEETELTHMEENVVNVENCCFDFFDIADLPTLSQQNTYLTEQVIVTNVGATNFYINCNHRSVNELRKLLAQKKISTKTVPTENRGMMKFYKCGDISKLGVDHAERQIFCQVQLTNFQQVKTWFQPICTSCYAKTIRIENQDTCRGCQRIVPYPDNMFELYAIASDETGSILIILEEREVKKLIGKTVYEINAEGSKEEIFPTILNSITAKDYTLKIRVQMDNILKKSEFYMVTDIMQGFYNGTYQQQQTTIPHPIESLEAQASIS